MTVTTAHPTKLLAAIVLAPLERLEHVPGWGQLFAFVAFVWQLLGRDAFTGILCLVVLAGIWDYVIGVRAARAQSQYDPRLAHAGALGKVSGVGILLLVRLFEAWATNLAVVESHGALAIALAVSLFAVDLQSVAHHREELGAQPIPFLSTLFAYLQRFAGSKIPAGSIDPPAR